MTATDILFEIDKKVVTILRLINEKLMLQSDANRDLLDRYLKVFSDFQLDHNLDTLLKFREIYHRASLEGATTDYTETTSQRLDNQYLSLAELFEDIETLVTKYYELS